MKAETILLGGGIAATNPFTVNTLPVIVSQTPPSISDSVYKQSANGRSLSMGSGAAFAAANDQIAIGTNVIFTGTVTGIVGIGQGISSTLGAGSRPAVLIGNGITCNVAGAVIISTATTPLVHPAGSASVCIGDMNDTGLQSVQIGTGIVTTVNQSRNVLIGFGISASSGASVDNVMVGSQAQGVGLSKVVGVGSSVNFGSTSLSGSIIIGYSSTIQGARDNTVLIGQSITMNSTAPAILIAAGLNDTTLPANVVVLGGPSNPMNLVIIGRGQTHTATNGGLTIRATNGVTTNNLAMGDLTITAPLGTGNAAPGVMNLQTGLIQASGNTSQAARTGVRVSASNIANDTDLMVFDVDNAVLARVSVGAADSGGAGFKLLRIPN